MDGCARFGLRWAGVLTGAWLAHTPGTILAADPPPVAAPQVEAAPCCDPPAQAEKSVWDNVPPVRPVPRLGAFSIPPTGCGYYSALDFVLGTVRKEPPKYPYPPTSYMAGSFFDADYRYLNKPDNQQTDSFDFLKRRHLGCDWMVTSGGEARYRFMNEVNARFTGQNNDYDLFRTRVYGDLWYRDQFRVYAEFLYADNRGQELTPLGIDANRGDLLNLFVDVKVGEVDGKPVYVRAGRQELLLGSERLISPLDWANTRRTFEGVRGMYQGEKFDVDLFWAKPVAVSPNDFDSVDDALNFTGLWTTYRPQKGHTIDVYALNLDRSRPSLPGEDQVPGSANVATPTHFNITTLGTRYAGDRDGRLTWDFEGMLQVGSRGNQDLFAQAATAGVGYRFPDVAWTPHVWAYYDFASGDSEAGTGGTANTFNQLFPFGHYYLGFLDQVGRQNIQDLNLHLNYYPTRWVTGVIQYHRYWLAEAQDALYNAGGRVVRQDPTGRAGRDVGQEIDVFWNIHVTAHQDLWVGYSKLFAGDFIERTGSSDSPELFYLQYSFRW